MCAPGLVDKQSFKMVWVLNYEPVNRLSHGRTLLLQNEHFVTLTAAANSLKLLGEYTPAFH